MTLYERSYSFSDPNWSDDPVVENDEGTRTHLGQVRSAGQQYIAVIIQEITDTENTVVKVISKDATELYEVTVNKHAVLWDVNDNGEVLLYTETQSGETLVKELVCLSNSGTVKWTVDLTAELGEGSAGGIEIGTEWAGIVYNDIVKFYDVSDGSEVQSIDTNINWVSNSNDGLYQECYGSNTGFTLVYKGSDYKVVFVNKDGDLWAYTPSFPYEHGRELDITGRDVDCGIVSVRTFSRYGETNPRTRFHVIRRTGEVVYLEFSGYLSYKWLISPCSEWAILAQGNKIALYYVKSTGLLHISDIDYASGKSGEQSIDLSFYGKYAIILHDSNELYAYQLKDGVVKDSLSNPLQSRAVMVCSD
ncbi:hypothetical protein DRO24_01925 [Candidatus Bathyarchaeota archaeon]|nr:MAG: hypothetical protein DRO24_01925 [Candidatus Bathyarchaeota archaeon]